MFLYVPAISGPYAMMNITSIPQIYRWWSNKCYFTHKAVLVSYGILKSELAGVSSFWRKEADALNAFVIGDSGGFQVWSKKLFITPEEVVDWHVKNCDIGIILDVPPRGLSSKVNLSLSELKTYANKTAENAKKMFKYVERESINIKYYLVLHGAKKEELDIWWNTAVEPFLSYASGIAAAPRPPNSPKQCALMLAYLYNKGIKYVHLLAVSGGRTLVPMIYWENKFKLLTTDSSSFSKTTGRGRMLIPGTMTYRLAGNKMMKEDIDISNLICRCPVCVGAYRGKVENILRLTDVDKYLLASLHNLYWTLVYVDSLMWLNRYDALKSTFEELKDILNFLDMSLEDFDKAYKMLFGEKYNFMKWF